MTNLTCRFCNTPLAHVFADLGVSPISNDYLVENDLLEMEPFYPLCAFVCESCFLVQLPDVKDPGKIFNEDYAYFSSYSDSWLKHASNYVDMMVDRFGYNENTQIIEIASNDGYLLQYFLQKNIPVLGIEPSRNVAEAAEEKGIPSLVKFFGVQTASELAEQTRLADLLLGNNVLAHVPDINDFVGGMKILLKPQGVITMEFPHLMRLVELNQFDTIYHEHFSYLSLTAVEKIFAHHGLTLFDVEELPTHGGSLRIFARHKDDDSKPVSGRIAELRDREKDAGITRIEMYTGFQDKLEETKRRLLSFLITAKDEGKQVAGYGAPAKGNTLLNYCGIRSDLLDYTVDRSPHKSGRFLPGTHIPIHTPEKIMETQPDYVLILPWNLKQEIMQQMSGIASWGGRFVVPIPTVEVCEA